MLQPLTIGSHRFETPVFLAPMAGITDAPFRAQVRDFGAALVCSEMIASAGFAVDNADIRAKARLTPSDGVAAVQIAGREPSIVAEAARGAVDDGAAIIDLNFGCPAKKVTRGGAAGAALMREPARALRIVEATARAVSAPVTVKMRLGWDPDHLNAADLVRGAADAGAQVATVHGRTRAQAYGGAADWDAIGQIAAEAPIPIIANGDIVCAASAREALSRSGAAGLMIGRGAQGAPWLPAEIMADLTGAPFAPPSPAAQLRLAAAHHAALCARYGDALGVRAARKHLGWRLRRAAQDAGAADGAAAWAEPLRAALVRTDAAAAVRRALLDAADRLEERAEIRASDWSAAA